MSVEFLLLWLLIGAGAAIANAEECVLQKRGRFDTAFSTVIAFVFWPYLIGFRLVKGW